MKPISLKILFSWAQAAYLSRSNRRLYLLLQPALDSYTCPYYILIDIYGTFKLSKPDGCFNKPCVIINIVHQGVFRGPVN